MILDGQRREIDNRRVRLVPIGIDAREYVRQRCSAHAEIHSHLLVVEQAAAFTGLPDVDFELPIASVAQKIGARSGASLVDATSYERPVLGDAANDERTRRRFETLVQFRRVQLQFHCRSHRDARYCYFSHCRYDCALVRSTEGGSTATRVP